MKQIPLTQNQTAIVDDKDFARVSQHKWSASFDGWHWYAVTNIRDGKRYRTVLLHRFIVSAPPDKMVDHINGDTLDCRQANLRLCTSAQNQWNRGVPKNSASGRRGVWFDKRLGKWRAAIRFSKHRLNLGTFNSLEEASEARTIYETELYGQFKKAV